MNRNTCDEKQILGRIDRVESEIKALRVAQINLQQNLGVVKARIHEPPPIPPDARKRRAQSIQESLRLYAPSTMYQEAEILFADDGINIIIFANKHVLIRPYDTVEEQIQEWASKAH